MFTSWKQLIKASLSLSALPLLYQELMIRVMSLLSPRMFFSLRDDIWHEMRIQTRMTFYEDSKSFGEEHALCIKCSGTTGRLWTAACVYK